MQKQETIALHELGDQSSPDPASRLPCGLTIVAERFRKFWLGGCTEITLWTFLSKACITGCCSFHLCVLFILQIGLRCLLHKAELPFSCRNVLPPACCGQSLVSAILCAQNPLILEFSVYKRKRLCPHLQKKINFQNQSREQDVQVSYGAHRTLKPFPNMNSGETLSRVTRCRKLSTTDTLLDLVEVRWPAWAVETGRDTWHPLTVNSPLPVLFSHKCKSQSWRDSRLKWSMLEICALTCDWCDVKLWAASTVEPPTGSP